MYNYQLSILADNFVNINRQKHQEREIEQQGKCLKQYVQTEWIR